MSDQKWDNKGRAWFICLVGLCCARL